MLKLFLSATTDAAGNMSAPTAFEADASAYGDELSAVEAAAQFIEKQGLDKLRLTYGRGVIALAKGDDPARKADELFYSANAFSLYQIPSLTAPELKFGEPDRAKNIDDAAHSALRIAQKFNRSVSFKFNGFAVAGIEPKAIITKADIKQVVDTYNKAFSASVPLKFR